jgi:hypothetical protein
MPNCCGQWLNHHSGPAWEAGFQRGRISFGSNKWIRSLLTHPSIDWLMM